MEGNTFSSIFFAICFCIFLFFVFLFPYLLLLFLLCRSSSSKRLDEKAEQEATGFLLDLVSVSGDNGLKLPRGTCVRLVDQYIPIHLC